MQDLARRPLSPMLKALLKRLKLFGLSRFCPICYSWLRCFEPFGSKPRPDACCPVCKSLERHRLAWVFFKQETDLFDGSRKRMLHIAPEKALKKKLEQIRGLDYLTADLSNPRAMVEMDITDIKYPDNSFHVIYYRRKLGRI